MRIRTRRRRAATSVSTVLDQWLVTVITLLTMDRPRLPLLNRQSASPDAYKASRVHSCPYRPPFAVVLPRTTSPQVATSVTPNQLNQPSVVVSEQLDRATGAAQCVRNEVRRKRAVPRICVFLQDYGKGTSDEAQSDPATVVWPDPHAARSDWASDMPTEWPIRIRLALFGQRNYQRGGFCVESNDRAAESGTDQVGN